MQMSSDTKVAAKRNRVSVSNCKDSKSEFSVTGTEQFVSNDAYHEYSWSPAKGKRADGFKQTEKLHQNAWFLSNASVYSNANGKLLI